MSRGKAGFFLVLLLTASGCATHHAPQHGLPGISANTQTVSLHGFFGGSENLPTIRKLIPSAGEPTPLPPFWDRGVPLACFEERHKPLYLDFQAGHGEDNRAVYGLESSTLAFYVGHGGPNNWSVPRETLLSVPLSKVRGGDGFLRYFWLHSCNVMAHGPKDAPGDYSQPHRWSPGNLDVFKRSRWTKVFGPGLRMVCGGSTQIGFDEVGGIWENLLEKQTSVSDAFVLGVAHLKQVPVCLARGGESPTASALEDQTLIADPVRNRGWLHLQIPVRCKVEWEHKDLKLVAKCGGEDAAPLDAPLTPTPEIETLPRVTTTALPPPVPPIAGRLSLGFVRLPGAASKYHPDSGAVVLIKSQNQYTPLDPCDQVTTWTLDPWALLGHKGLKSEFLRFTLPETDSSRNSDTTMTALEMRVESRQDGAPIEDRKCWVRSLFLRFDTEIDIGTKHIPIFGPGITLEIPYGEKPELASLSAPRRELTVLTDQPEKAHRIKQAATAISEARQELQLNEKTYPMESAQAFLGYQEAPLRCRQTFLRPTYEIRFPPATNDYPTVIVRRDARINSTEVSWECRNWGDEANQP